MAKVAKARTLAPQASRFDGEALGLVLFAVGILLAVTVFSPGMTEERRPGAAQAIGHLWFMTHRILLWIAILLTIVGFGLVIGYKVNNTASHFTVRRGALALRRRLTARIARRRRTRSSA